MEWNQYIPYGLASSADSIPKKVEQTGKKIEKSLDKEKIDKVKDKAKEKVKDKAEEIVDSIDKDKINATIDQVADYFDPEKMKDTVDEMAAYFDPEKIKEAVDIIALYLNKETVKDWIDVVANHLNREDLKGKVDTLVDSIDKDGIKRKINKGVDEVADSLDDAIHNIKKEVSDKTYTSSSFNTYLKSYDWKTLVPDKTRCDAIILSGLKINGQGKIAVAKPGEKIEGEIFCSVDKANLSSLSRYHVVIGIKDQHDPQAIYSHFGLRANNERNHFDLVAPSSPGVYRIGSRCIKTPFESTALKNWEEKNAPTPVIGLLIVR